MSPKGEEAKPQRELIQAPGPRKRSAGREAADRRLGWYLLSPALLVLGTLTVYPALWVLWLSLQYRVPVFGISRWAGLDHFTFLLVDTRFWNAAWVTGLFTVVSVTLEGALGLAVAAALRGQQGGRRTALALLLLAWALPSVVTAKMFEWLYHPAGGLVNFLLGGFLLGGRAINWLGDPDLALPSLILADVWRATPFVALLCYARLLTIPPDLYEAARVDGAAGLQAFTRITWPLVRPILLVTLLFRTLDALRAFDIMFVLTGGGPAGSTESLTVYAYRALFQTLQVGFGSAIGVVVFALVMVVAALYLRLIAGQERAA
jgi:multiple sugar transport system permease protein